jgi:hypothetical protein
LLPPMSNCILNGLASRLSHRGKNDRLYQKAGAKTAVTLWTLDDRELYGAHAEDGPRHNLVV